MDKARINKTYQNISFHLRIMLHGFFRAACGAAVACMIAIAIYGFVLVADRSGWAAVLMFISSMSLLTAAALYIYVIGHDTKYR